MGWRWAKDEMDIRQKSLSTLKRLWAVQAMAPGLPVCEVYYIKPHIHPRSRGFVWPPFSCGVYQFPVYIEISQLYPKLIAQRMMNISQETMRSNIDVTSWPSIINQAQSDQNVPT